MPSNATNRTVTGLTNGQEYLFRVAAVNSAGTGPFSSTTAVTPAVENPNYVVSNSLGILNGQWSGAAESTAINGTWFYGGTYGGRGYWTRVVPGKGTSFIYFKAGFPTDGQYYPHWIIGPTLGGEPSSYSSFWYKANYGGVPTNDIPTSPNNVPAYAWESGTGYDKVSPGLIFTLAGAVATPVITITAQPTSQTVTTGASATLSVTASATESAPAFYQWQKQEGGSGSFVAVSGATGSSLVLSNLTNSDDNGDVYRCVVSAPGGAQSVTSSSATLTVTTDVTDYLMAGSGTAAVNGTWVYGGMYGTRRYWTRQVDGYGTGYLYFKAGWPTDGQYYPHWLIGPTLGGEVPTSWHRRGYDTLNDSPVFPNVTGWDSGLMGFSSPLTLTPVGITPVISITSQPSNQTASNGSATFSVTATVTQSATLSYQWQKQEGGSGSFSNVSGATSSSLALSNLTNSAVHGGVYRVVVSATGGAESVTSSSATLTVAATAGATDPYFANVSLLLQGSLTDASPYAHNITTAGTVYVDGNGISFDANNADSAILLPNVAALAMDTGDFTLEAMTYYYGPEGSSAFCDGGLSVSFYRDGSLFRITGQIPNTSAPNCATPINNPLSSWLHFVLTRQDGTARLYVNGVQKAAVSWAGFNSSALLRIGNSVGNYQAFRGYIDNVRLTKGICRYPDGTTFTPPAIPFPNS